MKHIFLFGVFTVFAWFVSAQQAPKELQLKIAGKKNLKAIMYEVEKYYKNQEATKPLMLKGDKETDFESDLLHWKRWEYFNQTRLRSNGDLEDVVAKTYTAWERTNSNNRNIISQESGTNALWNFIGPFDLLYQGGLYRGHGKIDRVVFHPTDPFTFYACSNNGGVWRTQDAGLTWTNITFYFPIQSASGLAINPTNPNNLYVITGDGKGGGAVAQNSCGIWVTYDGGFNWRKTSFNNNAQSRIFAGYKIMMMPGSPNILFAATRSGLYRTLDAGNTWSLVLNGPLLTDNSTPIYDVEFDPANPARVYASGFGRFYMSIDNGATFPAVQQTGLALNRIEIGVSAANANYVYLFGGPYGALNSNTFGGIFRSSSKGAAGSFSVRANTPNVLCWNTNGFFANASDGDQSNYDLCIAVSPTNAEAITTGGKIVWGSVNGGTNMVNRTVFNEDSGMVKYIHPDIQDVAYNPLNGHLFACTDGGIYRSTDNGVSWGNLSNGIHAATFYHMSAAPFDVNRVLGGTQDNGVKYKSGAGDFAHITGADGFDCSFGPSAASSIYTTVNSSIVKFDINGSSQAVSSPANLSFFPVIAADPVTNNIVYVAGGAAGVLRSADGGANWMQVLNQNIQQSICISANNASRVYVTSLNSIFRTDNSGANWTGNLAGNAGFINNGQITDINACPTNSNFVYATLGGYAAGQKVFYSGNAGATWINISGTLPANVKVNCVVVDQGNNAYIGTDMGVYYQAVSSNDWTPFYNDLPRVPVTDLAITQAASRIRASTYGHGIWETTLFTPCDANLNLTGTVAGNKFYQVYNQVTSNAIIGGGSVTNVITKAGAEIILSDGFTVQETNVYSGILGACEAGPVPQRAGKSADVPAMVPAYVAPENKQTLYPYGTIAIQNFKKSTSITIDALVPGNFTLIISDQKVSHEFLKRDLRLTAAQNLELPVADLNLGKGNYLVQLYYNAELAHTQELIVAK